MDAELSEHYRSTVRAARERQDRARRERVDELIDHEARDERP